MAAAARPVATTTPAATAQRDRTSGRARDPNRTSAPAPAMAGPRSIAGQSMARDGGHVDRRQAQAGQRDDALVPVDLGQVELRQADLLDGELRHLTSSSGSDRGRSRIRPDPATRTRKSPDNAPSQARYSNH